MIDIAIITGVVISGLTELTKFFPSVKENKTAQRLICLGLAIVVTLGYVSTEPDTTGGDTLQFASVVLGTAFLAYQTILKSLPINS